MSDGTVVIIILFALAAVVLLAAPHVSESLVRARARRLPEQLSLRMEEEWRAELNALTSRPGKLAFALALMLTRRKEFVAPGEDSVTVIDDRSVGGLTMLGGWKSLLIISTVVFALAAYGLSFLIPIRYVSESLILIVPRGVSTDLVSDEPEEPIEERLARFQRQILSRTSLIAVLREFKLSEGNEPTDSTVEKLLKDIKVEFRLQGSLVDEGTTRGFGSAVALTIRYVGRDPSTVEQVTQSVTRFFVRKHQEERAGRLAGSKLFLESQVGKLAQRLAEKGQEVARERPSPGSVLALDYDLLQARYRTLFEKLEEARMVMDLETRQIGEMLLVQDPAGPGKPIKPNRLAISGIGALVGCALGGTAAFGLYRRQRRVLA